MDTVETCIYIYIDGCIGEVSLVSRGKLMMPLSGYIDPIRLSLVTREGQADEISSSPR